MALVKWDICCQPMKMGSFGLRRLVPQSTSFFYETSLSDRDKARYAMGQSSAQ